MANNTIKFDIKAAVDTQGLDEFRSQLGELKSIAEPLDRVLGQAVKDIQAWAQGARLSERNTAAATSAINALTSAMTAGGNEWKKGTQAANDLNRTLRETVNAANAAKAALAAPARTTGIAGQQIADMRKGLQDLTIGSQQYLALLQQITEREALLGRRTGRAGVVAANQAFEGALLTRGYGAPDRLQAMPDTTAALRQRLSELSESLPNLIRGQKDYLDAAREMRQIERELARDVSRSKDETDRLAQARRRLADATRASNESARSGFAAFSSSIADNLAIQGSIDRNQERRRREWLQSLPPGAVPISGDLSSQYASGIGPGLSPQSTAALTQEYQRLAQALPSINRGSERYLEISREMRRIERDLARDLSRSTDETNALANARKRLADASSLNRSSNASGFAAWSSSVNDRLDAQNAIDQYRQQQGLPIGFRSGAAQFAPGQSNIPLGPAAPTELFRSIDGINTAGASARIQAMGRSYEQVAQQIRDTAQAAGGSTRALQAERAAWEQLQASLGPATREYRQAGREMQRLDRQLGTSTRGERFLESAGAISAGAFFGGPEGLIGGLAGMAIGGPGAALGGASIGAQVGIVRKAVGDMAMYSAELGKMRIALQGVVKSQQDYERSLEIVNDVTNRLNVPLQEALGGFTRLAASIIGAGGSISDAEIVFRGITGALKATGKGAEEVQGSITALSQIFSKGKLSAEEINQIAERLPGTFNLIAQAARKTGPGELAKALEQGQVGLTDVLRFSDSLIIKYEDNGERIAKSSEEAGARAKVAMDRLRETIGRTFQPAGAELQNNVAEWANWGVKVVQSIGSVYNALRDFRDRLPKPGNVGNIIAPERTEMPQGQFGPAALDNTNEAIRNRIQLLTTQRDREQRGSREFQRLQGQIRTLENKLAESYSPFAAPSQDKASEEARQKADREKRQQEEAAARQQRLDAQIYNDQVRLQEQLAENRIRLEDRVFQYKQELLRREREQQQQLDQLRQQTFVASLSPEGRSAVGPLQEMLQRIQGFSQERQALADAVEAAKQAVKSAKEMAANRERFEAMYMQDAVGASAAGPATGASSGIIARTGNTGDSTGPHLDGRWADRRPITAADLDRYIRVNGRPPSSYGVTSSYGPRSLFGRSFHAGVDVGTPSGSAISLINGAKLLRDMGNTGAGGYAIEIMTAQGPMRLLHLQAGSAARPSGSTSAPATTTLANGRTIRTPGAASAALRSAGASGDVAEAQAQLVQAQALFDAYNKTQNEFATESAKLAITQLIQPLRDQEQALRDNYQEWQTRSRLELEGVKPELIEFEIQKTRIINEQARAEAALREQLKRDEPQLVKALGQAEYERLTNELFKEREQLTVRLIRGAEELAKAQMDPALAFQRRIMELNQSLRDFNDTQKLAMDMSGQFSSNLANGFSSAASAIITGNGSIQQSFADLFNNVAKMFIDTISRVLADQATRYLLGLLRPAPASGSVAGLFSSALPMLGPAGGITGALGGFAGGGVAGLFSSALPMLGPAAGITGSFATGGISSGPTSGYPVTLHGTEAIVPLPNGRAIPVEMSGSGGTSVVVNVNMGTGEASVSSSERDGQLLGKALSEAVQAELVRQKRPGGLLYR